MSLETPELERRRLDAERVIGRVLIGLTYVAVAILVAGVIGMVVFGIDPLGPPPDVDLGALVADLAAQWPVAVLWLGLAAVIATPIIRVIAAAISFGLSREWRLVAIDLAILAVIAIGVTTALITEV